MIGMRTILEVADNSGAKRLMCILPRDGDKIRTVQFRAAGLATPNSLFFGKNDRLLVTPGLFEFDGSSTK